MAIDYTGKVVIVTGAANGIGKAAALAFAEHGATVVVADVKEAGCKQVVAQIKQNGGDAMVSVTNVADENAVRKMVADAVNRYGRLDAAFNNAGTEGVPGHTTDLTMDNITNVLMTNVAGTALCMKYEIPAILQAGGGAIVNAASIAAHIGFAGVPIYAASKHAVAGLTKTAALEFAKEPIRINAVGPGVIDTPMVERFTGGNAEAKAGLAAAAPMGRMGQPEEIAKAVLWLCSDEASYVNGSVLMADGGYIAQ